MSKKKVSIVIACYNEEDNIIPMTTAVDQQMQELTDYDYDILCIDNCSTDNTKSLLRTICAENPKVRAIFNVRNFGSLNSGFYGMLQADGDCVIKLAADFQDPVEMIPVFLKYWEEGYQIVYGVKTSSKENKIMYEIRTLYYKLIKKFSSVDQIEHFTGFGLYDKSFMDLLRSIEDPIPFLRGIVAELGGRKKAIPYEQPKRRAGKSKYNFYALYDAAMLSFTSYTKIGLRLATFIGSGVAVFSIAIALVYFILKLIHWRSFSMGMAPILIGMFFLGAVQLIFLGLIGEYILSINQRVMKRPLVVEEERINFEKE